jgi:hypothetical protein
VLRVNGNKVFFNGVETYIRGRSSFKFMAWINSHYSGKNQLGKAKEWIEWNQSLGINLLRVFGETEDWYDHGIFGSPPNNKKVWNLDELRAGHRPKSLTVKNEKMVTELFRLSHQTGMAFEYVIDATLKHTPGVDAGNESSSLEEGF